MKVKKMEFSLDSLDGLKISSKICSEVKRRNLRNKKKFNQRKNKIKSKLI